MDKLLKIPMQFFAQDQTADKAEETPESEDKAKQEAEEKTFTQQDVNNLVPMSVMREFGGLEMIMAVGAMLRAAELQMTILIDGFLMSNSLLMASKINHEVEQYALFSHKSEERGHILLLEYLGVEPLLHLNFCLGEGTGAVCAYPLVESSVRMMNQMKSFEESRISHIKKC